MPTVVIGEIHLILYLQSELGEGKEREESRHQHCDIKVRVVAEMERRKIKGEESFDEEPREVDALDAEETAGQDNDEEGEKHRWNPSKPFVEFLEEELVGADKDALQGAIHHKVPRGAVPQSADKETEPQVEILARLGLHPAAAQREIQIVLDEHAESLVPASPKL